MAEAAFDMTSEERNELVKEFLAESEQHLSVLNNKLLEAEEAIKANKSMSDDDLDAMFRAAHTIKGTASFIGLSKVVELTHEMETILQKVKNKEMILALNIIDVLFCAFDGLENLFTDLKESGDEIADVTSNINKIKEVLNPTKEAEIISAKEDTVPSTKIKDEKTIHPSEIKKESEIKKYNIIEPTIEETIKTISQDEMSEKELPKQDNHEDELSEAEKEKQFSEEVVEAERLIEDEDVTYEDIEVNEKYLTQYLAEAEQNIEDFNENLVALESSKLGCETENMNNLFRITHTIKGSSGIIGVYKIADISHSMENILSVFREKKIVPPSDTISLLFKAIDEIKALTNSIKTSKKVKSDITPILLELNRCFKLLTEQDYIDNLKKEQQEIDILEQETASDSVLFDMTKLDRNQVDYIEKLVEDFNSIFGIEIFIQKKVVMKTMKVFLVEERLKKFGFIIDIRPDIDEIEKMEKTDVKFGIIFCAKCGEEDIYTSLNIDGIEIVHIEKLNSDHYVKKEEFSLVSSDNLRDTKTIENSIHNGGTNMTENIETKKSSETGGLEMSFIRIDSLKLDTLMNLSGELVILRAQFARLVSLFDADIDQQKEIANFVDKTRANADSLIEEFNDYLKLNKDTKNSNSNKLFKMLDDLTANLTELENKITKSNIVNRINSLDETTRSLGKISSDIQSGVMQTRMIPIEGVFNRFKRIVRDISKDLGKDVILQLEGEETELDKKIVDGLGDPLTHMIRNAVDHAIEDKETRRKFGKSEIGTILLRASHKGNNICIEVIDDGRGLDPNKLTKAAVSKGIITEEQVASLTEKEKYNLMFMPGFSTAEKITGISGRGVGMDVVKNMINSVNGTVDIISTIGKGTTFALKIPLTLAIIQALLVIIGEETYAIPIEAVIEIIKVSANEIYSIDGNPTVKLRDHALSIIELERILQVVGSDRAPDADKTIVVITDGENQLGVVVDSLIGEDEIVIKSLSDHFVNVKGITGASILGDGRIALIIDPVATIKESK